MIIVMLRYLYMFIAMLLFLGGGTALYAAPSLAEQIGRISPKIVPHRALYDVSLVSSVSSSMVQNIAGTMFYELRQECEGWSTSHQFRLVYDYADAAPVEVKSDISTYENDQAFHFTSQRRRDGTVYQFYKGAAERVERFNEDSGEAAVQIDILFEKPEVVRYALPVIDGEPNEASDVAFPMQHLQEMLDHAQRGTTFFNRHVFDGNDIGIGYTVNSFIEGRQKTDETKAKTLKNIGETYTPFRLAFFDPTVSSSLPEYEMSFYLHDTGIIDSIVVDYPDFSIRQTLTALETLDASNCD